MINYEPKTIIRFLTKIKETKSCWEWSGAKNEFGYGLFVLTGKTNGKHGKLIRAHRFSFELLKGEIPKGLQLDHICMNKKCVNPDHLEIVTSRENTLRCSNAPASINHKKTHCKYGHLFNEKNTYIHDGKRTCRKCKALTARRIRQNIQESDVP